MRSPVPRLAAVHDLSGFGRASLTVVIPVLSTMGVQVCPLPTAVLSTHTGGFEGFRFSDLTDHMRAVLEHWRELGIGFDAVYSGFLGSPAQIDIVQGMLGDMSDSDGLAVVDPVMGDDGRPYSTMGPEMIARMRRLVTHADMITPNLTEAAFLLEEPYPGAMDPAELKGWVVRLSEMGPRTVVITGVPVPERDNVSSVVARDRSDGRFWKVDCSYMPAYYPGTGDTFTSVIVGSILQGDSLPLALDRAVAFVSMAIRASFGYDLPAREGVLLEKVLGNLRAPVVTSSYEMME